MPSFDIVSEVDKQEVVNAVDQANRELSTRFDFRGVDAKFALNDLSIEMKAEADFQLQQMFDIMLGKLVKRGIDVSCLDVSGVNKSGKTASKFINLKQGIDAPLGKKIVKLIKDKKLKVQAAIQGDQVRVTGKKRDDLQSVIAMLREADLEMPLQFNNFRD